MEVPNVAKTEYTLMDIDMDTGAVSVLLESGDCKEDLNLPKDEEVAGPLRTAFEEGKSLVVSVQAAMGQEAIISFKESSS
jgi:translation initiation factor 5A